MDRLDLRIKVPRKSAMKWRFRHNRPFVLAYAFMLLIAAVLAVLLILVGNRLLILDDSQFIALMAAIMVFVLLVGLVEGFITYYTFKYSVPLFEDQSISIDKANNSLLAESENGKGRFLKYVMKIGHVSESEDFFEVGESKRRFIYIPKNQLSPEECSFLRSLLPAGDK